MGGKTIEKVIRLCTVLIFFLSGRFEDMGIFHVFQLSFEKLPLIIKQHRA